MMTATAESPRAADALHKIAAAAAARSTAGDENAPANSNSKPPVKKLKETEPKQPSESDDANDDDDENDEEEDDEEEADVKPNKTSSKASKTSANTNSDDDKKASKKSRRELPPHTVAILKGWMLSPEHVKHPYPTDEDKQMLLKKTGINMKQLTNWFTNARKRIWKPMMRREHSRQLQSAIEFEKTRGGPAAPPYAMAPPMTYGERPAYPPRQAIRHSFDAGSLGGPPRDPTMMGYAPPPPHPYDVPPQAYPGVPSPHHGAAAYPPRAVRSVSESATRHDMDDYIDAMRIRKRVHEMAPDGTGEELPDKRFRRATNVLSPRCLQILHEWVATHRHMEYPTPNDSDKLQLSRDTGLDVQQIELWFKTNVGRFGALLQPTAMPQMPPHPASYQQQRSIPSRDNPMYPPPPAYGERRSIPSQGNPMFPPRPAARSSIPGAGNPQFPPPPAVRRDGSEGYARPPPGYPPSGAPMYPPPPHQGYDAANTTPRPMRTMSVNSGQYPQPPAGAPSGMPPMPTPVGAPGSVGLPSLTGRPMPGRQGPPMGQARDARSHTLDMGQFADARRRKMNFQDILASTSGPMPAPMPMRPVAEPLYPTEVAAPYAQKQGFEPPSNGATEAPVAGSTSTSSSSRI